MVKGLWKTTSLLHQGVKPAYAVIVSYVCFAIERRPKASQGYPKAVCCEGSSVG